MLRHYLVAVVNDPTGLPALETDPRVHYEAGAKACALAVASLLPPAIERVEKAQRRAATSTSSETLSPNHGAAARPKVKSTD